MAPEPRDKLDATTRLAVTVVADGHAVVNGPEGEPLDWGAVDWRRVEEDVRRLRQRIFAASKAGDLKKVRNLQKLMVRHEARLFRMEVKDRPSLRRRSGGVKLEEA